MKRLIGAIAVLVVLVMVTTATAKLSRGDQSKIRKWLAVWFDTGDKNREEARAELTAFLSHKRKIKELKEVEALAEIVGGSANRDALRPRQGVVTSQQWALKDQGIDSSEKFPFVVSVPKKYSGTGSEPWPMILCLPDKGEKAEDYMEKYWNNSAIRNEYLIFVLGFEYRDVKVKKQRTVEEKKGDDEIRVRIEDYEETVPFSWTERPQYMHALVRFWGSMAKFQKNDYKVDPNRIILDGHGFGADGVLNYAAGSAWRFAGVILRGGSAESPILSNLAHLPILSYPEDSGTSEGSEAAHAKLKAAQGDNYAVADAGAEWSGAAADGGAKLHEWLGKARRNRYPVPSKWVKDAPANYTGYWLSINKSFVEGPSEATIDAAKGKIEITTVNVASFDLYLNDLLVNLDKEFELIVNGESRGKFKKERSAVEFISHLMNKAPRDLGCVFTAEMLEIEIAPPPAKDDGDAGDGKAKDGEKKDGEKKDAEKKDGEKKDSKKKAGD